MNLILFFLTMNLILLSRLGLTFKDEGAQTGAILKMAAIPLIALLFMELNGTWLLLFIYLITYPAVIVYLEKSEIHIYKHRLVTLLMHAFVVAIIFSPAFNAQLDRFFADLFFESNRHGFESMLSFQAFLFGGLLVMNEMNIALRYSFKKLKLEPIGKLDETITDQQYNTGRIIGMLERIFIYLFALSGQYAAIGFILTAKGIVRYKEFVNRQFAEYVLIGTLLSALFALLIAMLVRNIV